MSHEVKMPPRLTELLARFLNEQAQAQIDGLADFGAGGEVTPYEAGPVQPIDAKLAWQEAVAAAPFFVPGVDVTKWPAPPHWASLVAGREPAVAVPFCLGNFPQLVRNFHLIAHKSTPADFQPSAGRSMQVPALLDWAQQAAAKKQMPQVLLALGSLRLANNLDQAEAFVKSNDVHIPQEWRATWSNEKAALAWHQGRTEAARTIWSTLEPNVPVLFNRGMAELFAGNAAAGHSALSEVVVKLPEHGAWHHLARLYMLLAPSS